MSRFYEAMKRALEQQAEPHGSQEASSSQPVEAAKETTPTHAMPFDPDGTTPVRRDPLDELEDYLHALPAPAAPAVEASPAPVPLRLAERPAPNKNPNTETQTIAFTSREARSLSRKPAVRPAPD